MLNRLHVTLSTLGKHFTLPSTLFQLCSVIISLQLLLPIQAYGLPALEQLIKNGGFMVEDDLGSLKYREHELFVPASTLKILTSLVALKTLGQNYRFKTCFYIDEQQNLYIKGYGDPFLTSEVVLEIGKKLADLGAIQLRTLFLDDSAFALKEENASIENSDNPYDAPNGALAVNFNALPVHIQKNGTISSGEPQTPLISLMKEAGKQLSPGLHRINVNSLVLTGQLSPSLQYTGELFHSQLKLAGISIQGSFTRKQVPQGLRPIYIHNGNKSLEEIIRACLKNSNNYIANQLFLACGAQSYGLPATWDKSRQTFAAFTEESLRLRPDQIIVKEGSGLSRQNRISASALIVILDHFKQYSQFLKQKDSVLIKSGTMKDVYCYAGYFPQENSLTSFAILLNQTKNNRDEVLKALHSAMTRQDISVTHQ